MTQGRGSLALSRFGLVSRAAANHGTIHRAAGGMWLYSELSFEKLIEAFMGNTP